MRRLAAAAALLLLAACGPAPIVVGAKEPTQDRILGEMFALLLEEAGVRVERRIGLGDSADNFEALRRGAIDLYPEYTGTALGLIGAPRMTEPDAALAMVRAAYAELGLVFLEPLGFESTYAVVTRRDVAAGNDLETVTDLRKAARRLRLGVTTTFAERPTDGLDAALDGVGLRFADVVITPGGQRTLLYDALLRGDIDVMVGFSTDPEIRDFALATLELDLPIFPAYEAVPLARIEAVEREPRLEAALAALAGRLDSERIRRLTREVQIGGRSPRGAAAGALADLGLITAAVREPSVPLGIAAAPVEIGSTTANTVLRAVRAAMPGRNVAFVESARPLASVAAREARLAMVPAIAHFETTAEGLVRDERFEAIAVVGSTLLHAVTRTDGPDRLGDARVIVTGPEGSSAHKLARVLAAHRDPAPEILALENSSLSALLQAVTDDRAEAAIILAPRKRKDVTPALGSAAEDLRLVDATDWWEGAARLELPFLRVATLTPESYPWLAAPVRTLAMQTTLVGPTPPPVSVLGRQGPSSYSAALFPLSDAEVLAINEALGPHPDVGPHLRRAAALTPGLASLPSALNPQPGHAVLLVAIVAFLGFAGWLLVRPRPRDR